MPYTVAEFAQKIREKYNAYQDVDDQLLVDKMIEKYPVYADQISEVKKKEETELVSDSQEEVTESTTEVQDGGSSQASVLEEETKYKTPLTREEKISLQGNKFAKQMGLEDNFTQERLLELQGEEQPTEEAPAPIPGVPTTTTPGIIKDAKARPATEVEQEVFTEKISKVNKDTDLEFIKNTTERKVVGTDPQGEVMSVNKVGGLSNTEAKRAQENKITDYANQYLSDNRDEETIQADVKKANLYKKKRGIQDDIKGIDLEMRSLLQFKSGDKVIPVKVEELRGEDKITYEELKKGKEALSEELKQVTGEWSMTRNPYYNEKEIYDPFTGKYIDKINAPGAVVEYGENVNAQAKKMSETTAEDDLINLRDNLYYDVLNLSKQVKRNVKDVIKETSLIGGLAANYQPIANFPDEKDNTIKGKIPFVMSEHPFAKQLNEKIRQFDAVNRALQLNRGDAEAKDKPMIDISAMEKGFIGTILGDEYSKNPNISFSVDPESQGTRIKITKKQPLVNALKEGGFTGEEIDRLEKASELTFGEETQELGGNIMGMLSELPIGGAFVGATKMPQLFRLARIVNGKKYGNWGKATVDILKGGVTEGTKFAATGALLGKQEEYDPLLGATFGVVSPLASYGSSLLGKLPVVKVADDVLSSSIPGFNTGKAIVGKGAEAGLAVNVVYAAELLDKIIFKGEDAGIAFDEVVYGKTADDPEGVDPLRKASQLWGVMLASGLSQKGTYKKFHDALGKDILESRGRKIDWKWVKSKAPKPKEGEAYTDRMLIEEGIKEVSEKGSAADKAKLTDIMKDVDYNENLQGVKEQIEDVKSQEQRQEKQNSAIKKATKEVKEGEVDPTEVTLNAEEIESINTATPAERKNISRSVKNQVKNGNLTASEGQDVINKVSEVLKNSSEIGVQNSTTKAKVAEKMNELEGIKSEAENLDKLKFRDEATQKELDNLNERASEIESELKTISETPETTSELLTDLATNKNRREKTLRNTKWQEDNVELVNEIEAKRMDGLNTNQALRELSKEYETKEASVEEEVAKEVSLEEAAKPVEVTTTKIDEGLKVLEGQTELTPELTEKVFEAVGEENSQPLSESLSKIKTVEDFKEVLIKQKQDAVQKPQPKESVLRPEQPKVELQEVGKEVEVKDEAKEKELLTTDQLEKRLKEIEDSRKEEDLIESNEIEKILQKREWDSVMQSDLKDIPDIVDKLITKDKEMPNGFGPFIEMWEARETKRIAEKYLGEVSKEEAKKDFNKAMFGNPQLNYSDGLRLRESANSYLSQGGTFKELTNSIKVRFETDGFSEQDAYSFVKNKLDKVKNANEPTKEVKVKEEVEVKDEAKEKIVETLEKDLAREEASEFKSEEVVKDLKEKLAGYKTQAPKTIKPTQKTKAKSKAKPKTELQELAQQLRRDSKVSERALDLNKETITKIDEILKDLEKEYKELGLPKQKYTPAQVRRIIKSSVDTKLTQDSIDKILEGVNEILDPIIRKDNISYLKNTLYSPKKLPEISVESRKNLKEIRDDLKLKDLKNKTTEELKALSEVVTEIISKGTASQKTIQRQLDITKYKKQADVSKDLYKKEDFKEISTIEELGEFFNDNPNGFVLLNDTYEVTKGNYDKFLKDNPFLPIEGTKAYTTIDLNQVKKDYVRNPIRVLKGKINPANQIATVENLMKSLWRGAPEVRKILQPVVKQIKNAYTNNQVAREKYTNVYYDYLSDVFGSKRKGVKELSKTVDGLLNPTSKTVSKRGTTVNNGQVGRYVAIQNLYNKRANQMREDAQELEGTAKDNLLKKADQFDRILERSGVNEKEFDKYIEANPKIKEFGDNLYKVFAEMAPDFAPTYEKATNMIFEEELYVPDNKAGKVDETGIVGATERLKNLDKGGDFIARSALSDRMKDRTDNADPIDLYLDATNMFVSYVRSMSHAKEMMPIAENINEVFNKPNIGAIYQKLGKAKFESLMEALDSQINLNADPVKSLDKIILEFNRLGIITNLALSVKNIPKQAVSFMNYSIAGYKDGINPVDWALGFPKMLSTKNGREIAVRILQSPYLKERIKKTQVDPLLSKAIDGLDKNSTYNTITNTLQKIAMSPVMMGDAIGVVSGGVPFAVAVHKQKMSEGMSFEDAWDYTYKRFVEESNESQQTSADYALGKVARSKLGKLFITYKTAQTSAMNKALGAYEDVRDWKNLNDKQKKQTVADAIFFSVIWSIPFLAVGNGAINAFINDEDDDVKERKSVELLLDAINSNLQGLGVPGFVANTIYNIVTEKPDDFSDVSITTFWANIIKSLGYASENVFEEKNPFDFDNYTDSEKKNIIKVLGFKNANDLYKNFNDGQKSVYDAIMNYQEGKVYPNRLRDYILDVDPDYEEVDVPMRSGYKSRGSSGDKRRNSGGKRSSSSYKRRSN